MADFRMVGERENGSKNIVVRDGRIAEMNKSGTKLFYFARAEVEISRNGKLTGRYISERDMIEAPDGCLILPYFCDDADWQVVLVEQFRIAIPGKTTEPAGGEANYCIWIEKPKESMARELEEETHIKVDPNEIELVFCEMIEPSMLGSRIWAGIIEISKSQLPVEIIGEELVSGECTVIVVKPLIKLLKDRDAMRIEMNLRTSRLLDELAKKVGLLTKNY
jgi:8-oxo-dGTP pyrophosphatase MutT (NUDIX family)